MIQSIEPFGFLDSNLNLTQPKSFCIWGAIKEITFTLSGYEISDITEQQKQAYNEFIANPIEYIKIIETSLFDYYVLNRDEIYKDLLDDKMAPCIKIPSDLRIIFDWNQLYFLPNKGIVFMFEVSFEPEMGIGVLMADKEVQCIDVQAHFI